MMDLRAQFKAVDAVRKGMRGELRHLSPVPFVPEKPRYPAGLSRKPLPRSTPEAQGVSSAYLERFLRELDACPEIKVHSIVILRHGKLIAQANWKPYSGIYAQMVYSLSKSVTAMAVGMAIEEGLFALDDRIAELFSDKMPPPPFRRHRVEQITVRHLLNMTSGIRFNEANSVFERDWLKSYLTSDCAYEPGEKFTYNSMNSYLLSALIQRKTGEGLTDYLQPRLFEPLGIDHVVWERCPMGIEKGGWGLFLRPEDMAKLGQLYLQKGMWTVDGEPRRLLSEQWIIESTDMGVRTLMGEHETAYGYHLWEFPIPGAYQFNGVFGQYVVVIPQIDAVIAITSGSHGLFVDKSAEIIQKYFDSDEAFSAFPLPENMGAARALKKTEASLALFPDTIPVRRRRTLRERVEQALFPQRSVPQLSADAKWINGRSYKLENSYGTILPFIFSVEKDSFLPPIQRVSFAFAPDFCTIEFSDGEENQTIRAGLDGEPRRSVLNINEEVYVTGNMARLTRDEDGRPVLKLYISFLETPNTRVIKFIFSGERILVRFQEIPSVDNASKLLASLLGNSGGNMERLLTERLSGERVPGYLRRIAVPKASGRLDLEATE